MGGSNHDVSEPMNFIVTTSEFNSCIDTQESTKYNGYGEVLPYLS